MEGKLDSGCVSENRHWIQNGMVLGISQPSNQYKAPQGLFFEPMLARVV